MIETVSVGKLVAVVGLKGEMILQHALGKTTDLQGVVALMIEEKSGSKLPYFLQAAKGKAPDEVVVQLEGIDSREKATALLQKQVWLKKEDFEKHVAKHASISLLGFMVIDHGKKLGEIAEVIEQPHQLLCTIFINEKEVLIPLHEDSLLKIDQQKKQVHVHLPEGLLEIYLSA